jgi:AraC-like DNA-binding protein
MPAKPPPADPAATLLADAADAAGARPPLALLERLFDALPDVVFFAKDAQARYTHGNRTLLERLRLTSRAQLIGRRADELFGDALGGRYLGQDQQVLRGGGDVVDQLELHLYPSRAPGWCLTHKLAWRADAPARGRRPVIGLVGLSRDLAPAGAAHATPPATYARVAQVVERLQRDYAQPLRIGALARAAGLSVAQLERVVAQLYRLTPRQVLARARLDAAIALLAGDASIAEIAHACGYADHSAFTRQFRQSTGLTPRAWRALPQGAR